MKKNLYLVLLYLAVSIFVFAIGIQGIQAVSDADAQIVKCSTSFNNTCSKEGECSWTTRYSASNCDLKCWNLKVDGTGEVVTEVDCGRIKPVPVEGDPVPAEPTGLNP